MICGMTVLAACAGRDRWVTTQPAANAAAIDTAATIRFMVVFLPWRLFARGGYVAGRLLTRGLSAVFSRSARCSIVGLTNDGPGGNHENDIGQACFSQTRFRQTRSRQACRNAVGAVPDV